jgi:hypothetical protein
MLAAFSAAASRRAQRRPRLIISPRLPPAGADIPITDDEWEVETVLQCRNLHYHQEQWLINWKG